MNLYDVTRKIECSFIALFDVFNLLTNHFPSKIGIDAYQIIDQAIYYTFSLCKNLSNLIDLNVLYDWDRSTTFSLALKSSHNQPHGGILPKLWKTDHAIFYQNFDVDNSPEP